MTKGDGRPPPAFSRAAGRPRYGLPSDLSGSLCRLDDGELDTLLAAATEEARRRGRPGTAHQRPLASGKKRPLPATPSQAKLIRAAYEAGVKPAAIARQLRLSRVQVKNVNGRPKREKG